MALRTVALAALAAAAGAEVSSWCPADGNSCNRNGDRGATCSRGTGTVAACFCSQGFTHPSGFRGKCVASGQTQPGVTHTTTAVLSLRFGARAASRLCGEFSSAAEAELAAAVEAVLAKPLRVGRRCPELTAAVAVRLDAAQAAQLQQRDVVAELNAEVRTGGGATGYPNLRAMPALVGTVATESGECVLENTLYTMSDHLGRCNAMACEPGASLEASGVIYTCRAGEAEPAAKGGDDDWSAGEIAGVVASLAAVLVVCIILVLLGSRRRRSQGPATPRREYSSPPPKQSPLPPLQPQARGESARGASEFASPGSEGYYLEGQNNTFNPGPAESPSPHSRAYYSDAPSVPPPRQPPFGTGYTPGYDGSGGQHYA